MKLPRGFASSGVIFWATEGARRGDERVLKPKVCLHRRPPCLPIRESWALSITEWRLNPCVSLLRAGVVP